LWVRRTTDIIESGEDKKETTNVLAGSNMIAGVRYVWFVFPEGGPRPANPTRSDLEYSPSEGCRPMDFWSARDGMPVPGQKYNIEMDYTLFETDNPPPADYDPLNTNDWRPQDGRNYRILLQRTLKIISQ
jgi:hypothetical protein